MFRFETLLIVPCWKFYLDLRKKYFKQILILNTIELNQIAGVRLTAVLYFLKLIF